MTDRAAAPKRLRVVQRFINTVDLEEDTEVLADAEALADWLADEGLLDPDVTATEADHAHAIALREALRALTLANSGHRGDTNAVATVNEAGRRAGLRPTLTAADAARVEPTADGVDGALGRLVAAVHEGIADGTWSRLKACERESCRWAYYDHSRNRSSHWCSMAVCGSREKNKRAYRRRRARAN